MAQGDDARPSRDGDPRPQQIADESRLNPTAAEPAESPLSERDVGPEPAAQPVEVPEAESVVTAEPEAVAAPEPVSESVSEPEPVLELEPVSKPEPVSEPVATPEPELEPVSEPVATPESVLEPVSEPEPEPVSEPVVRREPDAAAEPAGAPALESASEPEAPRPGASAEPAAKDAPPPAPGVPGTKRPAPPGGRGKRPAGAGKIVEGVVTAVSSDEVELTLDDGRLAVINRRNFAPDDQDPSALLSPGDRAFGAELSREDPKQRVVLSRAWALKRKAWERVMQVAGLNETLTGTVVSLGSKGVVVDVGVRGFVPTSHLELEPITDLKSFLGQTLELKVLEADAQRERLVLSRRSLLLKAQRQVTQKLLTSLKPGDSCRGTVTSITSYGAFVDIGGVNGLVHLSELSWRRVGRPSDVVSLGDEVDVQVLDVKAKKRRVSLSIRRTSPDPLSELQVGEVRTGPVTRLVDFGAFVALGDLEGLVHLSELAEYRVSTPEEVVAPGDEVGVKILSVDKKRRRIELSIRQAAEFGG